MNQHHNEEKPKFVHGVFESIARDYDRMNSLISFNMHKRWRQFAMKKMEVKAGDYALDICCGTADWTLSLAHASQTGKIVGLDFSQNMLAVGQEKVDQSPDCAIIELVQGDAMALPFEDDTFDHVTIGFALRNVKDLAHVLKEMKRVVKPGGQVVSLDLSKPTWKPFRAVYYLYFRHLLPFVGKIFANRYEQYKWLPESLLTFPDYKQLGDIMKTDIGLENVGVYPLTGGIMALHIGHKPFEEKGKMLK
ncbi:demethylmenaquinone methyltransferase [Hazenella sp. IB182357]|uniref:Demethylmenaquinone methyltransferase n=1 Tax=Polycladospora coralii TaxID=2771432 RepID=A0A926RSP0_9BACL|nr:demethylmenaquinone methyltransferase [Polycladospora coralii]MBD1371625.1 demethylmenaquinone methyltransferase [Polycladospora coralii]MBS7529092.1 demethylmenaquinone methyltransferase [Polycladospora coralii]